MKQQTFLKIVLGLTLFCIFLPVLILLVWKSSC